MLYSMKLVLDHKSITYYIKEVMKDKELSEIFDKSRKFRNSIKYYGENVSYETVKETLAGLKSLERFIDKK